MKLALLIVLTGCIDYAHTTMHSAPPNIDLATPLPHENGDPARNDHAFLPTGSTNVALIVAPYVLAGVGRAAHAGPAGETGVELRYEQTHDGPMAFENWGITGGIAISQFSNHGPTSTPGALYLEGGYRFLAVEPFPFDVSAGPLVYVDNHSVGAQLTVRWALFMVRSRYVANTGFELFGGAEIPIPFFFGWSQ
jgi:hypothetical protein